ncbi:MAG: glutamate--tRNA ligase [Mariprofundaceae bacterium]|nr:glutamate--tRNA ligase [Mariprofundaceae bacterium]
MISSKTSVITRFAPSPTGLLHLGNVRTALLNYLFAKQQGGKFLLRFEDTDQNRSQNQYIAAIKEDLLWLNLPWDGDARFQSAHAKNHQTALSSLTDMGDAYPCFCSEHQLNLDRKLASSRGLPPRYNGRCRALSVDERAQRMLNEAHVWRLAIHQNDDSMVIVHDLLRKTVDFRCRDLDDPVVVRSDGSFTFLLPNAVDDALDGVTHALRGDDHLTNSAYQVWLLQHLQYNPPIYLHHGLLLGMDGAKLSKRTGSHNVADLRNDGLLAAALVQAMARLGHPNMPEDAHTVDDLAACFQADHISTGSVRWMDDSMWRQHTQLLHNLPASDLAAKIIDHIPPCDDQKLQAYAVLIQANIHKVEDAVMFSRLLKPHYPLNDEALSIAHEAGRDFYTVALNAWLNHPGDWKLWTQAIRTATAKKGRALFMPLRIALTGNIHGPEMGAVIAFLGTEGVRERLLLMRDC